MHSFAHRTHDHQGGKDHDDSLEDLLDLDAAALPEFLSEVTGWVAQQMRGHAVRRVLDLGSGTGTGALALLDRFPTAHVTAVDASASMLARLDQKVNERGIVAALSTHTVDLDRDWPSLTNLDLVWASSSMHHLADPDTALQKIAAMLAADGVLALVETTDFPMFLPFDQGVGEPGLEQRCHDVMAVQRAASVPAVGSDWASRLKAAGLNARSSREVNLTSTLPPSPVMRRYAVAVLGRVYRATAAHISDADRNALQSLLTPGDPNSVAERDDVQVTSRRIAWLAGRA
jgi:SAM-dependent methyltransferase